MDKESNFLFDSSKYDHPDHGRLEFRCFGIVQNGPVYLAKGRKIYYEQKSAGEGYWLGSGDYFIVVGDEEETIKQLRDIHFIEKNEVNVWLKQPDFGGTISICFQIGYLL